jgi:long-subunit fatty acid transport protein
VFSGGYTFITTYPYGSYPLPENLHEHNVWEQIELKQKFGKTKILHRYRLEQRWIGNLVLNSESTDFEADGYVFRHRFRYRFTALVDLSDKWFLHFFDELFIRSGEEFKLIGFDRNWLYGGVGYKVNDRMNIQLAYLHQYIRRTANLFEQHHTIQGSMVLALGR